jgi:putative transposase
MIRCGPINSDPRHLCGRLSELIRTHKMSRAVGANSFARASSGRLILNAAQLSYTGSMPYEDLRRGRHSVPNQAYHVTTVTAARVQYFAEFALARIVVGEMRRIHDQGDVKSLAWVLMPDHLHWLFYLSNNGSLSTVMKRLKSRSAHAVNRRTGRSGPVWEIGFHTMRCVPKRICGRWRGISSPILCEPGWLRDWLTIHIGTQLGCNRIA